MGRNGPIFQFTGKAEKLKFGLGKLELGIEVRSILIIHVELGILLVT